MTGQKSSAVGTFRKKSSIKKSGTLFYVTMIALPLLQFVIFYVIVNFNSILMAFQNYDNSTGKEVITFTWDNFAYFFNADIASDLWLCVKNSLMYLLLNVFVVMPVSLLFSYYVFKKFRMSKLFKVIMFLPSIVCSTAMVIFYKYYINDALSGLFGGPVIGPTFNPHQQGVLIVFYLLMSFSGNILLYINAMCQTPESVIEAAKIDGANEGQVFLHVVVPQIWGTIVSLLVIFLAWVATNQAYLFTFYGFNANRRFTGSALQQMYRKASALGLMLTLIVAPITILVRNLMLKYGPKED